MSYLFMSMAFKQTSQIHDFKLHDAPWDNQNKTHNQDKFVLFHRRQSQWTWRLSTGIMGNMASTWRLIKETAASYFIGYYCSRYQHAG